MIQVAHGVSRRARGGPSHKKNWPEGMKSSFYLSLALAWECARVLIHASSSERVHHAVRGLSFRAQRIRAGPEFVPIGWRTPSPGAAGRRRAGGQRRDAVRAGRDLRRAGVERRDGRLAAPAPCWRRCWRLRRAAWPPRWPPTWRPCRRRAFRRRHGTWPVSRRRVRRRRAAGGDAKAGRAVAVVFAGFTAAMAIGVPVGAYIGETISWRLVLATIAACGGVGCAGLLWGMKAQPATDAARGAGSAGRGAEDAAASGLAGRHGGDGAGLRGIVLGLYVRRAAPAGHDRR